MRRAQGTEPDVWMAFVWCAVLLAVFVPLAIRRYRQVAARLAALEG